MPSFTDANLIDTSTKLSDKIGTEQFRLLATNLPIYLTKLMAQKIAKSDDEMAIKQVIKLNMLDNGDIDFECTIQVDVKEVLKDTSEIIRWSPRQDNLPGLDK